MKAVRAIALIVLGAIIGFLFAPSAIHSMDAEFLRQFLPQFVATLAGVLVGAGVAVWAELHSETSKENERRAATVNLAMLTISRMQGEQRDYRQQVIDKVRKDPVAWYSMSPASLRVLPPPQLDYVSLQFLFASSNPGIVHALALEEDRFASLVEVVERRSRMHHEEMQSRQEATGMVSGTVTVAELEKMIGPRIAQSMKDYTIKIVEFCDLGIASTAQAMIDLRVAAVPLVGNQKIINFVVEDAPGSDAFPA